MLKWSTGNWTSTPEDGRCFIEYADSDETDSFPTAWAIYQTGEDGRMLEGFPKATNQTFPTVEAAVASLPGTTCFCEGDGLAVEVLEQLAEAIGAKAVRIGASGKSLYHAAPVVASNYLVSLLAAAAALAEAAGVARPTWAAAVEPLLLATVENVSRLGPAAALTGPIARGDVATVARHVEAMAAMPAPLRELYASAGRYTIELARRKGTLGAADAKAIGEVLDRLTGRE